MTDLVPAVVLAGPAVYGVDESQATPGRKGAPGAANRVASGGSLARLRAIDPSRALFAHDCRPSSR